MSQSIQPTPEQKKFAASIGNELYARYRSRGVVSPSEMAQVVRDMIQFRLAKEGWSREDGGIELMPNSTPLKTL